MHSCVKYCQNSQEIMLVVSSIFKKLIRTTPKHRVLLEIKKKNLAMLYIVVYIYSGKIFV